MHINIDELSQHIDLLLQKLKEAQGETITLSQDFYWSMDSKELFNPYTSPSSFTLGQLTDDLKSLSVDNAVVYDLNRIAILLKAIAAEYPIAF